MILQWFAEMFFNILQILFSNLNVPRLPVSINTIGQYINMIITNGAGIVAFFISPTLLKSLFGVVVGVMVFEELYTLVMWILKKVPMVGIK